MPWQLGWNRRQTAVPSPSFCEEGGQRHLHSSQGFSSELGSKHEHSPGQLIVRNTNPYGLFKGWRASSFDYIGTVLGSVIFLLYLGP